MEIKKKNEAESNPDISNDKPSSVKNETDKINELKRAVAYNLFYNQGTAPITATLNDYYMAVAHTVRDRMQHLFVNTVAFLREKNTRIVSYLSAEFLMGPQLANNLLNLGLYDLMATALQQTGLELGKIIARGGTWPG
jgi:starch phosphorylase